MQNKENNYAFIDSQNLNLGIKSLGWKLDFVKFRRYLREKYGVVTAYLFILGVNNLMQRGDILTPYETNTIPPPFRQ